jgi:hypothetical protein
MERDWTLCLDWAPTQKKTSLGAGLDAVLGLGRKL